MFWLPNRRGISDSISLTGSTAALASTTAAAVATTAVVTTAVAITAVATASTAATAALALTAATAAVVTAALASSPAAAVAITSATAVGAVAASTAVAAAAAAMVDGLSWLDCCWLSIDGGWRIWRTQCSCCSSSGRPPSYSFRKIRCFGADPDPDPNPSFTHFWKPDILFWILFTAELVYLVFYFSRHCQRSHNFPFFFTIFCHSGKEYGVSFTFNWNRLRSGSAKMMPIRHDPNPRH